MKPKLRKNRIIQYFSGEADSLMLSFSRWPPLEYELYLNEIEGIIISRRMKGDRLISIARDLGMNSKTISKWEESAVRKCEAAKRLHREEVIGHNIIRTKKFMDLIEERIENAPNTFKD